MYINDFLVGIEDIKIPGMLGSLLFADDAVIFAETRERLA